jgi:hypothetical protein
VSINYTAPGGNQDQLAAALADLLASTSRGGQLRYVSLLRELITAQSNEVVSPLREKLGNK